MTKTKYISFPADEETLKILGELTLNGKRNRSAIIRAAIKHYYQSITSKSRNEPSNDQKPHASQKATPSHQKKT